MMSFTLMTFISYLLATFLPIIDNAVNICVQVFVWVCFPFSSVCVYVYLSLSLGVKLLDNKENLIF